MYDFKTVFTRYFKVTLDWARDKTDATTKSDDELDGPDSVFSRRNSCGKTNFWFISGGINLALTERLIAVII